MTATSTVFFGSGPFAIPILDALQAAPGMRVAGVVTGASSAVFARASEAGLPVIAPRSLRDEETLAAIVAWGAPVGVLADYGRIVPAALIGRFDRGILNVHPSLLPRWRGASPIAATIAAGDATAGVTVIALDAGVDTGPIVASDAWALSGRDDAPCLRATASERGAALLIRVLEPWIAGSIEPTPQDERLVTSTRPLTRDDGSIDGRRPARDLERLVRALRPWPGTFLETDRGRLIIWQAREAPTAEGDRPGLLVGDGQMLALATDEGRLVLDEVQPAGGRRMGGDAYLRGRGRAVLGSEVKAARTMDRAWLTYG